MSNLLARSIVIPACWSSGSEKPRPGREMALPLWTRFTLGRVQFPVSSGVIACALLPCCWECPTFVQDGRDPAVSLHTSGSFRQSRDGRNSQRLGLDIFFGLCFLQSQELRWPACISRSP